MSPHGPPPVPAPFRCPLRDVSLEGLVRIGVLKAGARLILPPRPAETAPSAQQSHRGAAVALPLQPLHPMAEGLLLPPQGAPGLPPPTVCLGLDGGFGAAFAPGPTSLPPQPVAAHTVATPDEARIEPCGRVRVGESRSVLLASHAYVRVTSSQLETPKPFLRVVSCPACMVQLRWGGGHAGGEAPVQEDEPQGEDGMDLRQVRSHHNLLSRENPSGQTSPFPVLPLFHPWRAVADTVKARGPCRLTLSPYRSTSFRSSPHGGGRTPGKRPQSLRLGSCLLM